MKIQDIMHYITYLRKNKKHLFTNYFLTYQDSDMDFPIWKGKETIIFLVCEEKIQRCFFASTDEDELCALLKHMPTETVMDYITKEKRKEFCWLDTGFVLYRTLIRYTNLHLTDDPQTHKKSKRELFLEQFYDETIGGFATINDAEELYKLLYSVFDFRVSRLPSMKELIKMIEKKWVLLYREQQEITAFLMYKIEGKKYYGYQIYNEGTADITYNLEQKAISYAKANYQVKSSYAWVETNNLGANERCEGSNFDGTYDYIFVKK